MNIREKLLFGFQQICRLNFGSFEKEEFKKFIRLGLIFSLMIGVHWTLVSLKDSLFIQLVSSLQLPYARSLSAPFLIPLVIFYNKLFKSSSRDKMMVILPAFYGCTTLVFGFLISLAQISTATAPLLFIKVLGYLWYVFVESYGSLAIVLFWSFATDLTEPAHAKRGFPLIYAFGQIGGIVIPYSIGGLPYRLHLQTDTLAIALSGALILLIIPLVKCFLQKTPAYLLRSTFTNHEENKAKKTKPKLLEDLKTIITNRYLFGIFITVFIHQIIITVFDFNFKIAASKQYSGVVLSNYFSTYSACVNTVTLLCLLLGISNISRYLGIGTSLIVMPLILCCAFLSFLTINTLSFLFVLLVGSKAINYALNGPVVKQLYIPVSSDIRFKGQAWIDAFGFRISKQAGSLFNMSLAPLQTFFGQTTGHLYYLIASSCFVFPLIGLWIIIAIFLSATFHKAVEEKIVVC